MSTDRTSKPDTGVTGIGKAPADGVPTWQRRDPVAVDPIQYKAWCDDKLAAMRRETSAAHAARSAEPQDVQRSPAPVQRHGGPSFPANPIAEAAHTNFAARDAARLVQAQALPNSLDEGSRVQHLAAAGVAGPAAALPHGDQIQASFGHHDVTGVQAHVGGAASEAAEQMGAQAYATGNQVAFASSPDLHLAAHEAAHVVQQRLGVHLKGGVGQAGDSYEQHADAVADAVVAGRSAEPLLDQAAGAATGPAAAGAVQRDDLKQGEVTEADRDQVIYTNIVAGQNELDEVLTYLAGTKTPDQTKVEHKIMRASLYLMEAQHTKVLGSKTNAKIAAAIASCNGAQTEVINAIFDDAHLYDGTKDERDRLEARVVDLMRHYGVEGGSELAQHKSTLGAGKDGKAPELAAMKASLHLAELEAASGFQSLVANTNPDLRVGIVTTTSMLVHGHLGNASMMMSTDFDAAQLAALKPAVEAASAQILLIKRWMDGRQGNKKLISEFSNVLAVTNGTRERVGLAAVDLDETKGFPEREEAEETLEKGQMDKSVDNFAEAWQSLYAAMDEGVEQWFELAKQGEQNKPSFGQQVLTALITAAVGNLGGIVAKGMFSVAGDQVIKAAIQELVAGVASDASQAILNPAVTEAVSGSGTDPNLKSLLFVRGGLKEICRKVKSRHVTTLNDKVAAGTFSIAQVQGLEAGVRAAGKTAMAHVKTQSATDWVRYVAQAGMGGDHGGTASSVSNEVTNLDGYFGEYVPSGPRQAAFRRGNHEGNVGMLGVEMMTYERSITGPASGLLNITRLDVEGLNKEMAELIMTGDDIRTLDDVKVPKEIVIECKVYMGSRSSYAYPKLKLVVDERGIVKDVLPVPDKGFDPPIGREIWEQMRGVPLPKGAVV